MVVGGGHRRHLGDLLVAGDRYDLGRAQLDAVSVVSSAPDVEKESAPGGELRARDDGGVAVVRRNRTHLARPTGSASGWGRGWAWPREWEWEWEWGRGWVWPPPS